MGKLKLCICSMGDEVMQLHCHLTGIHFIPKAYVTLQRIFTSVELRIGNEILKFDI